MAAMRETVCQSDRIWTGVSYSLPSRRLASDDVQGFAQHLYQLEELRINSPCTHFLEKL
jgi:hypothetical protein